MSDPLQKPLMPLAIPRRALLAGAGALAVGLSSAAWAAPDKPKIVTVLGDSITAGFGLPAADALPAQLQAALTRLGVKAQVRPSGVSGDTSADGLARADFSVKSDTDLCLVFLGGNDLLQGVDPKITRANLQAILGRLKARRIPALLAGLKAPPAIGAGYARDFDAVFPQAARAAGVRLYPNLLAGVMFDAALNQGDGMHPNAQGVKIIVARLAPAVAAALKSRS
jgi:acyl-CoA thioesterase-1